MSGEPEPKQPWHSERDLSVERVLPWILRVAPWLEGATIRAFGEGWDNAAFLVGEDLVVRFPRRTLAVSLLNTELECLPALRGRLPLEIPYPELSGISDDRHAWPFVGYRLLKGTTACMAGLDESQRALHARPLGGFLGSLHTVDPEEARGFGALPDQMQRCDVPYRSERAVETLAEAVVEEWIESSVAKRLRVAIDSAEGIEPKTNVLCHGDLYVRHLIIEEGALTGIIDWGDLHLGDPAVDLAAALTYLPPVAWAEFESEYCEHAGPVADETWRLAWLRAVGHTIVLLAFGERGAEPELSWEARRSLGHLAAEIGSRFSR